MAIDNRVKWRDSYFYSIMYGATFMTGVSLQELMANRRDGIDADSNTLNPDCPQNSPITRIKTSIELDPFHFILMVKKLERGEIKKLAC